jgi:hypothetical protein
MTTRIQFQNFWDGFPKRDNIITCALSQTRDVEIIEHVGFIQSSGDPDIIFRQGSGGVKDPNTITISWLIESMDRIGNPNYDNCHYSLNSCNFDDDRNYRIPFWATQINWNNSTTYDPHRAPTYFISLDKLFNREINNRDRDCCSVASNQLGKRVYFYPKISQAIDVVHGGDFLRNTPEIIEKPGNSDYLEKIEFISKFKSHLCFENDDTQGYICEKILHAFYAGCLPIYWGPSNVVEDFNRRAFINVGDFESDDDAIAYIKDVLSNESKLSDYISESVFPEGKIPYHATPECLNEFFTKIGI